MAEDYIAKMERIRPVERLNFDPELTTSTVKMQSMDNFAYPTIFSKDPDNPSPHPNDWIELDGIEAFEFARERGDLFRFKTNKEADEFAKGNWKPKLKEKKMRDIFNKMLKAVGE
jgi:hypothetical protein